MNLRKLHLPRRKNELIIILLGIIGIVAFIFLPSEAKIKVYDLLPSRDSILDVNFTVLITLFSIFTAYAIFIYQLIHNRYPVRSIARLIDIDIRNVYFTIFCFGIITLLIWITGTSKKFMLLISLFLMISTVLNFIDFIFRYRRFDINSQIKDLSKKFVIKIESNEITINDIKEMINDVDSHFKDSLEKHESYFSISIVKLLSSVMESYIINRDRIILDKCQKSSDLDELEKDILDMLFKNYSYLINTNVEKSVRRSFMFCITSLLKDLIKCDKYSLFENCTSRLESILFLSSIQSSEDLANDIMSIISISYDEITEEKCVDVKYEQNLEDFFTKSLFTAEMLIEKNSWLRQRMLIEALNMLSLKVKTSNDKEYTELFKKILSGIDHILMRSSENSNDMIWGSLLNLGKETVYSGIDNVLIMHINSICDLIKSAIRNQRKQIVIHGSYLLRNIRTADIAAEIEKLLYEKCKDFTFYTLETFPSVSFLFLPDYKDIIAKSIFRTENIDIYIEDLSVLFSKLVRIDKSEILYTYLEEFNQIIEQCEQKDRKVQESLFNIYENILEDSLIFKSFENFKMVLYKLEEVIINTDNAKKLSKRTIKYILSIFSNVSIFTKLTPT